MIPAVPETTEAPGFRRRTSVSGDELDSEESSFSDSDFDIESDCSDDMKTLSEELLKKSSSRGITGTFLDSLVTPVIPQVAMPERFAGESSYRLSLTFLLSVACLRLFPNCSFVVQSSYGLTLDKRSYLCRLDNVKDPSKPIKLSAKDVARIKMEVLRLVDCALAFESMWMSQKTLETALKKQNMFYTMKLIRSLNQFQYNVVRLAVPKMESTPPLATDSRSRKSSEAMHGRGPKTSVSITHAKTPVVTKTPVVSKTLKSATEPDFDHMKSPVIRSQPTLRKTKSGFDFPQQGVMSLSLLGASDISRSSLDMHLDEDGLARVSSLTMHKNLDARQFDVYVTLQHRDFLGNTKFLRFFELFCVEDPFVSEHSSVMDEADEMKEEIKRRDEFFVLCFADKNAPKEPISYPNPAFTLQMLYRKGVKLGRILGLQCVGDINERIQTGRTKELILLSEAYHDQQIVHIATAIKQRHKAKGVRAVLISGPSSSGKTTFACKLAIQLKLCGLLPVGLQVDMYYKSTKDPSHPRDENGVLNFEIIDALRLDLLNEHLKTLLDGGTITEPFFDFSCGDIDVSRSKRKLQLHPRRGVLIMEGIFCLNPKMSSSIGASKYQIFICPTPFYNLDNLNFLSEQVVRLIRRVSRDNKHRGANAEGTLFKWGQIQKGEELNMFSFVHLADCVFNSCLVYELPVLNAYSKPLLQTVNPSSPQFKDAKTLRAFCDSFVAMPDSDIPRSSLLMEFIKSSVFDEIDS